MAGALSPRCSAQAVSLVPEGRSPDSARPPGPSHNVELPAQPGGSLTTFQLGGTLPDLSSIMQTGTPQSQSLRIPSPWSHASLMIAVILTPSPKEETASWCQPAGPPGAQAPAGDGPGQGPGCMSQWGVFVAGLLLSQWTLGDFMAVPLGASPEERAEQLG